MEIVHGNYIIQYFSVVTKLSASKICVCQWMTCLVTKAQGKKLIYKCMQRTKSGNLLSNLRLKIKIYGKL